jgi:hypothetical protein
MTTQPSVTQAKPRFIGTALIVLGVALVVALGMWTQTRQRPQEPTPAVTSPADIKMSNSPPTVAVSQAAYQKLKGRWCRPDGGYILEIKSVDDASGQLDAAYFNPQPIHVAKAMASRDGADPRVFIELRGTNYPGSTYTLVHDVATDQLKGIYFQAAMQQQFEVVFDRVK